MGSMKNFLRLQNSVFGNNPSTNSSCPSSPIRWCMDVFAEHKLCIQNPTLIPLCILALILGIYCSKRISKLSGKFPTRWLYHITFFFYGIMMTSAGILHCFMNDQIDLSNILQNENVNSSEFFELFIAIIDVGLTSSIAISFLFCGLCDIQFLNPQSICTRILLFISYCTIFILWTLGILNNWNWINNVLYTGVVSVSCFIYLLTQLCIKSKRRALPALIVGGIYGAIGLVGRTFGAEHICKSEGPFWSQYVGPEFIWFLFSDISIAFVFLYVLRANEEKKVIMKKYDVDIEKNPEKF